MHVGLRVSITALTILATTVSLRAIQASTQTAGAASAVPAKPNHPEVPKWPYPQELPKGAGPMDDGQPHHIPGSTKAYTLKQVDGGPSVDWFQELHPKAPVAVAEGKADVYHGCGNCHLMNGNGRPETQSLNGLPVGYMQQQIQDLKTDQRHASIVFGYVTHMVHAAKFAAEPDVNAALGYFHARPAAKWTRVVEAANVPKTTPGLHGLLMVDASGAKEALGNKILEVPENYERSVLRDPTSGYVAYVPPGSLAKGENLVKKGVEGHTVACVTCHGPDLRGMGDTFPPIAGRSPSATTRQLYDFKTGERHGQNSAMMKPVVENLTDEDIIDITAYLASLPQ